MTQNTPCKYSRAASNRWAQWALALVFFLVGLVLTFIVIHKTAVHPGAFVLKQQQTTVRINGQELPVEFLAEVRGRAGLTQDELALRIAAGLARHAMETGTEACANICRAPDGAWGAAPLTIGGHVVCPITELCPNGMTGIGESIHSHPADEPYLINKADLIVLGGCCRRVGQRSRAHARADEFSPEDFDGGPGYMVTFDGKLYHQSGRRKIRSVTDAAP